MEVLKSDFKNIVTLIIQARNKAFSKVNTELILLYFNVGHIVSEKVASGAWGEGIVNELAVYINEEMPYLTGFNRRGLYRMKQFYETYFIGSDIHKLWLTANDFNSAEQIVSPLATQLNSLINDCSVIVSPLATQLQVVDDKDINPLTELLTKITWSNHLEILSGSKSAEEKLFYLLISVKEKLNKLELRRQIKTGMFERTILAKTNNSASHIIHQNLLKDPYIFEFLDLPLGHSENDLEKALIENLQKFIVEIGKGFTYMGNQYRLQVGNKDYYSDLLFYNRDLQCLVLFELKIEEFQPEFLGKLNFYLEALDRDVKKKHENPSIGILLCKGKDNEVVEYAMARNTSPAIIADFEMQLISKKVLRNKLHQLVEIFSKETKAQ
jgi:predicted nuclease of restriction endonuclease-like (RecB) superfamily